MFLGQSMFSKNIVELIHSFNTYLLSTFFSVSNLLGTQNIDQKEADKVPAPSDSPKKMGGQ